MKTFKLASIIISTIILTSCASTWEVSSISKGTSTITRTIVITKLPDKMKTKTLDCQPIGEDGKKVLKYSIIKYRNKSIKRVL